MCVDVTEMTRVKAAEARQQEMEQRLALQEKPLKRENQRAEQDKLITALASDYWSVYYVELDTNEAVCYQEHPEIDQGTRAGDHFPYLQGFTNYAENYITDEFRNDFLTFIQPDNIREGLKEQRVISFRYIVRRNNKETYEMIKFAGVRAS